MKQHNNLTKLKNSFSPQQQQKLTNIISDDMPTAIKNKMKIVIQFYRRSISQNGYNQLLAYRVIVLCLLSKQKSEEINLVEEINRFFKNCMEHSELDKLRLCFDLLLLKELHSVLLIEQVRLLKIRLLRAMKVYYKVNGNKKDKRSCGYTLEEYCKQALIMGQIKRKPQIYCQILDILIEQIKIKVSNLSKRKNRIAAAQVLTNFIQLLQKSDVIANDKYQVQLMQAYWSLAVLHSNLHYIAYTRKYAEMALKIAQRTKQTSHIPLIQNLLEMSE